MKNNEYERFLKKQKLYKIKVVTCQLLILLSFVLIWQILSDKGIINSFLCSSPKKVIQTIINLYNKDNLFIHIFVIWAGANQNSIIIMALLISVISSIISIYVGFKNTNQTSIKLLKSFNANKFQIFTKVVFPSNINTIITTLKINLSMTFVGVIMGELLVSKNGLGYLINYGSQVFNTNLVITGVILLAVLTSILYLILILIEKKIKQT